MDNHNKISETEMCVLLEESFQGKGTRVCLKETIKPQEIKLNMIMSHSVKPGAYDPYRCL